MASVQEKGRAPAPVVFNERLAAHLRLLDSGADDLANATIRLRERLDQHTKELGFEPVKTHMRPATRRKAR